MIHRLFSWLSLPKHRFLKFGLITGITFALLYLASLILSLYNDWRDPRTQSFWTWGRGSEEARQALITAQQEPCAGAPFLFPANGFVGLLYGDPRGPYSQSHPHQGIDIFSPTSVGLTPVYAAYDGYITRESDWKSTLIQRIPDNPLNPGEQIWLYYTHMADQSGEQDFIEPIFAPGTRDFFVEQGTLLGYTGNYSGNPVRPVGVHLHFSILRDDGAGNYLNELDFTNSYDPSPFLGMSVNYGCQIDPVSCSPTITCEEAIRPSS